MTAHVLANRLNRMPDVKVKFDRWTEEECNGQVELVMERDDVIRIKSSPVARQLRGVEDRSHETLRYRVQNDGTDLKTSVFCETCGKMIFSYEFSSFGSMEDHRLACSDSLRRHMRESRKCVFRVMERETK